MLNAQVTCVVRAPPFQIVRRDSSSVPFACPKIDIAILSTGCDQHNGTKEQVFGCNDGTKEQPRNQRSWARVKARTAVSALTIELNGHPSHQRAPLEIARWIPSLSPFTRSIDFRAATKNCRKTPAQFSLLRFGLSSSSNWIADSCPKAEIRFIRGRPRLRWPRAVSRAPLSKSTYCICTRH